MGLVSGLGIGLSIGVVPSDRDGTMVVCTNIVLASLYPLLVPSCEEEMTFVGGARTLLFFGEKEF